MPDSPTTRARVDDTRERTVSVASRGTRAQHHPAVERQLVSVGPGRPSAAIVPRSDALRDEVDEVRGYPIDLAKVQRPALRDETLERPRLLDWLKTKVNGRVVLVLADAGYGKTTLLADFSRRTRMRTLWYRLDEEDRDWRSFLHHLVAAGREYDPSFAPKTAELLADVSVGGPTRESVLEAFLQELPTIAAGGAILILDDYHLVDDAPDARFITRDLVQRAPDRVSIVFASRRAPSVPLAKLRAVGDVAELGTDDLRFDLRETEQLFSETYGRPLDPDVLADLSTRTEGWILSLQLVQAAIRDRNPTEIRRFVRSLTGADRDLYDYLAEEVVGDLAPEMQRFLMETSILQVVTPPFAEVVTGIPATEVGTLIAAAERLTLLSRVSGGPRTHQRYHPLVREFLEARLRSIDGDAAVAELHRRTAARLASTDWRIGAHHYREAADTPGLLGVIEGAIPTIMGNGQYALADAYIRPVPADVRPSGLDLILSRVDMQHGDYDAGIAASQAVLDAAGDDPVQRDHALLNLLALYFNFGNGEKARYFARELSKSTADPNLRGIADATSDILLAADDGDINDTVRRLTLLATEQRDGRPHHYGVSMFNLAGCSLVQDRLDEGLREVDSCLDSLEQTSSGIERVAAGVLRGSILMRLGRAAEADQQIGSVLSSENEHLEDDALIDAAEAYTSFGNPDRARMLLDRLGTRAPRTLVARRHLANAQTGMFLREGKFADATTAFANYPAGLGTDVGGGAQRLVIGACLALMTQASDGQDRAAAAVRHASEQNAHSWRRLAELLYAASSGASDLGDAIGITGQQAPWHLTYLADVIIPVLDQLSPEAQAIVKRAADLHPDKWRFCLREYLARADASRVIHQARLLEQIGERSDIPRLRAIGRSVRRGAAGSEVGRALIRRLAPPVFVEDQGRVRLRIGPREVAASEIRRKVLALVCFLLTRADLSATRDQVLDAIWPDLDPDLAQNSLNQTLYFLRRVLEEAYSDDLSPGYVRHDSDVIWLDPQLVTSRSRECRDLIHSLGGKPSPEGVERLVVAYHGRFALDFEYEEWAGAFRDSLHAAYLEIVERAVAEDSATGHFDRGIVIARRALEVDPSAEQIEVSLLRMYRSSGAHAAAAEQYAHYATVMRNELGLEPPPLESL